METTSLHNKRYSTEDKTTISIETITQKQEEKQVKTITKMQIKTQIGQASHALVHVDQK